MKCTAKHILEHYNEMVALKVGFICHVHITSPTYLCQAFPETKYVKQISLWREIPCSIHISWPSLVLLQAGWTLVRCAPSPLWEVSHGQVWYYIQQADPRQRHLVAMCHNFCHIDQMYLHPLVETANGQVWYYCEQDDLQSEVPPNMRYQTRFAFGQMSCQVNIMSHVPPTQKVIWTWKEIDPHRWLLHPERPFTQEGNYLVSSSVVNA